MSGSMYIRTWLIQLNRSYKYNCSHRNGTAKIPKQKLPLVPKFGHFRGVPQCTFVAQNMPPRLVDTGKKNFYMHIKN